MKPKTAHIGAKVTPETFAIVDQAAVIRGWPRAKVVELGALEYAQRILETATGAMAQMRRMMRQSKARSGGVAKARKRV
jgi:uncharacterized protein (DUF1778 family)